MKVRVLSSAPFFLGKSSFLKNPCYDSSANFPAIFVCEILTIRKVINHGNPRWRDTAMVAAGRWQRFFMTKEEAQSWLYQVRWKHQTEQFWQSLQVSEHEKIILSYKPKDNEPKMKPQMVSIAVRRYIELKSKLNLRPKTMQQIK